ncbi:hypothetical protein [Clostridium estertheticum]|uniref:hypothetical protein n=1 Tax=Clostridium estertheticum TaxID=238834 RepID=UPI001C0AA495|nr:hypothetical protein [Clostridium estertheticum]MBU3075618.1 hypothetical protein [Clostridium estertheticum]MBU3164800.1 hypothetical protein [Clostridium estertheticum]
MITVELSIVKVIYIRRLRQKLSEEIVDERVVSENFYIQVIGMLLDGMLKKNIIKIT